MCQMVQSHHVPILWVNAWKCLGSSGMRRCVPFPHGNIHISQTLLSEQKLSDHFSTWISNPEGMTQAWMFQDSSVPAPNCLARWWGCTQYFSCFLVWQLWYTCFQISPTISQLCSWCLYLVPWTLDPSPIRRRWWPFLAIKECLILLHQTCWAIQIAVCKPHDCRPCRDWLRQGGISYGLWMGHGSHISNCHLLPIHMLHHHKMIGILRAKLSWMHPFLVGGRGGEPPPP